MATTDRELTTEELEQQTIEEWMPSVERAISRLPVHSQWRWVAIQIRESMLRARREG